MCVYSQTMTVCSCTLPNLGLNPKIYGIKKTNYTRLVAKKKLDNLLRFPV